MAITRLGVRSVLVIGPFLIAVVLAACDGAEEPAAPSATVAVPTPASTDVPVSTEAPAPVPSSPVTTSTAREVRTAALSPDELYSLIAPSVPLIEAAGGTVGGVLIEGGYVLTSYQVMWPYGGARRIAFPDGTELYDVPVVGSDPIVDLAVLGPVDVQVPSLSLADGENLPLGSELFLVGYTDGVDASPQASITQGILSRYQEWEPHGITLLQTDATIGARQTGGALVDSEGRLVGIPTRSVGRSDLGLVVSAADYVYLIDAVMRNRDAPHRAAMLQASGRGEFEYDIVLAHPWDTRTFLLEPAVGSMHQFWMDGPGNGYLLVLDRLDQLVITDQTDPGLAFVELEIQTDRTHFLQVGTNSEVRAVFRVGSTIRMLPLHDPDDNRVLALGETITGSLDHFSDTDWYSIYLDEGITVTFTTDSLGADTAVWVMLVDSHGARVDTIGFDDNSGEGILGTNARLNYHVPIAGNYYISIADPTLGGSGGYFLSVEQSAGRNGATTRKAGRVSPPSQEEPGSSFYAPYYEATYLTMGRYDSGTMEHPAQVDRYVFEVSELSGGTNHRIEVSGLADAAIRLYRVNPPDEVKVPYIRDLGQGFYERVYAQLESGWYLVEVEGFGGALGTYSIHVDEQSKGLDGFYISVLLSTTSKADAERTRDQVAEQYGDELGILRSDDFASLRPGYWVVYAGPFGLAEKSQYVCWEIFDRQSAAQCYGRRLSQDPADREIVYPPAPS